jgi:hypothetical protein
MAPMSVCQAGALVHAMDAMHPRSTTKTCLIHAGLEGRFLRIYMHQVRTISNIHDTQSLIALKQCVQEKRYCT